MRALGGYLAVLQHRVVERCAQLIAEMTGTNISWAAGVLEEAAGLAAESGHTLIRALLTLVHDSLSLYNSYPDRLGPALAGRTWSESRP
ncbi:hypothetical protein ACFFHJ_03075 [Planotetraspora thailandica]|uniref:hypothetical protein n=1 Tax=Planotetraspora thailandica TaxID=487172 RepID=UPI00194FB78B|nr:hypothetical protein [Planotetraspora thailandica]